MSKTKRGISLGIILLVIIILCVSAITYRIIKPKQKSNIDEYITEFKIKDIKVSEDEVIDVEIELLNNSDFVAANFEYIYDSSKLEYIDYKTGKSLSDAAMLIVNDDQESHKVLIGFVANPNGEKTIKTGNMITLRFKVKNNISGNEITNEFVCTTLKDENGTDIKYNIKQGVIEIE